MKYAYVCTIEDDEGKYFVQFPDLENVFTEGDTLEQAIEMAEDALPLMLCDMEDNNEVIPPASSINDIKSKTDKVLSVIKADTLEYRERMDNRAIKKTLSIPKWLDTLALKRKINFSKVLQKALMKECNVK